VTGRKGIIPPQFAATGGKNNHLPRKNAWNGF
jgi:hypothetical protein